MKVKHNKTGKIYVLLNEHIINATNKDDGAIMVLYRDAVGNIYTRERKEFWEKFTLLKMGKTYL